MSTPRPMFQTWFTVFVAVTGVLSLLPYRERALMPAPTGTEQGLLAQEISDRGASELVDNTIAGPANRIARADLPGSGARRLIAGLLRGGNQPGAGGLGTGIASALQDAGVPGLGGTADGSGSTPGVGTASLAGGTGGAGGVNGVGGPGGGPGNGPVTGPQGPAALTGAAGELLAAVVPEPSTWLLFIAGLMAVGQALRASRRSSVRSLSQS